MDHIESFEDLVTSMKHNGVSYDYLFCKLFPHSLGGEAAYWLKQLPTGSLTNWDETKKAFLRNFYDDARSEDLRNNISQFTQRPSEAFKSAWVRFRAYQRDCPHHGFSEAQLLGIFFRGVDWRYQMALDAASNGNFNTRSAQEAYTLIENLASSNSTKNADFERQKQAGNIDGKQIAELKTKLDSVHNILVNKKSVHSVAEVETFEPATECEEEDVNYISGNGFQNQRFGNQQGNGGYSGNGQRSTFTGNQNSSGYNSNNQYQRPYQNNNNTRNYGSSSYQTPPAATENSKLENMMEQLLEGQQKNMVIFNGKFDSLYTDLNGKIKNLSTHVKKLDIQVAQTAGAVKRQEGIPPGQVNANPKYQCNAITAEYDELGEISEEDFLAEFPVSIDTPHPHRSTHISSTENPSTPDSVSIDTARASIDTNKESAEDSVADTCIDRCISCVDRHVSPPETVNVKKPKPILERVYRPRIPYPRPPRHLRDPITPKQMLGFEKMVRRIPHALTFEEALERYPLLSQVKDCRETIGEIKALFIKARNPPLRQLKKKEDPGIFSVPCSIAGVELKESLVDSGAGVNVMSRDIAEKLGVGICPPKMTLIYADNSSSLPHGTISDLMVTIGECIVPTDFHILEMGERSPTQLILGRSFMATAGAIIDSPGERISFSYIDKNVYYKAVPIKRIPKHVSCIGVVTAVTPGVETREAPSGEPDTSDVLASTDCMTLIPLQCDGDSVDCKVKCKGTSKPFSKVKVILPPDSKEKGIKNAKSLLRKTLKMEVSGCRTSLGIGSHSYPD